MQRVLSFPTMSRGMNESSEFVTKRMCCSFLFSIGFLALVSGFLLGRFAFDSELTMARKMVRQSSQKPNLAENKTDDPYFSATKNVTYHESFSDDNLRLYRRLLADASPENGKNSTLVRAEMLQTFLRDLGFSLVSSLKPTFLRLSYPDAKLHNQAIVLNSSGNQVSTFQDIRKKTTQDDSSTSSTIIKGEPVYVNFGRDEDYLYLDSVGISVSGHVVLARAGGIPAPDIVITALEHEAIAVLIFLDPQQNDVAPEVISPEQLALLQPETPKDGKEDGFPTPVLVLSSSDAKIILQYMAAREQSPASWRGALPCSYPLGPGFSDSDWSLEVTVSTANIVSTSYDVVAAIKGAQDPDQFVILGASIGEESDLSGSIALMEVSNQLASLMQSEELNPYRSVVIGFWGQNNRHPWKIVEESNIAAYLDFNFPRAEDIEARSVAVYGSILLDGFAKKVVSPTDSDVPYEYILQIGMEDTLERSGVPYVKPGRPLSQNETTRSLAKYGRTVAHIMYPLIEQEIVPFSLDSFVKFLTHTMDALNQRFQVIAKRHKLFLETLTETIEQLKKTIQTFNRKWEDEELAPLSRKQLTDQLIKFSRALFAPRGHDTFPQKSGILLTRHLIFAPSETSNDKTSGFGELQDLLRAMTLTAAPEDLHRQILTLVTDIMRCLRNATYALNDEIDVLMLGKT